MRASRDKDNVSKKEKISSLFLNLDTLKRKSELSNINEVTQDFETSRL